MLMLWVLLIALILLAFIFMAYLATCRGRDKENKAAFYRRLEQYVCPFRYELPETFTVS
jgi:hypothetical protein